VAIPGFNALYFNTTGNYNTAVGANALTRNTIGNYNTAEGTGALFSNTTGSANTAVGLEALFSNTIGFQNTATGHLALFSNTTGTYNIANGLKALFSNITGTYNTANGYRALYSNTTGSYNTANGRDTLYHNTTGGGNTATGSGALFHNTNSYNTANGSNALYSNTIGYGNTANGDSALFHNTTGFYNTAIGIWALYNNTTGTENIGVGPFGLAGYNIVNASHVIAIGHPGEDVSDTTWIGNIYGVTTQNATTAPAIVSADGQLGTVASSERFKKDIATMDEASEAILSLRPVTFHYKTDTKATPQFGLIAEEVAKVNPALVLPDKEGKPYSVRYDAVNAMLLNEFLKEHQTVQELTSAAAKQGDVIASQQKQIEALTAGLQKVSAQLEASKPAPQVVKNDD
jgi:hypothetical protein